MTAKPILVWFRRDLRVDDNPALHAAVDSGAAVIPVFLWSPQEHGAWAPGAASRWWLHRSLLSLQSDLAESQSTLVIRKGESAEQLRRLIQETGAAGVFWNRCYEPDLIVRDRAIQSDFANAGLDVRSFPGNLLFEPWEISTKEQRPHRVFTPFWKACLNQKPSLPVEAIPAPRRILAPDAWPDSVPLDELNLEPTREWADGLRDAWTPGAEGAQQRLDGFLSNAIVDYPDERNRPDHVGTSRLSPHLHFGEISVRRVWHAIDEQCNTDRRSREGRSVAKFRTELGWREFAHHVLYHFPHTTDRSFRERCDNLPWMRDARSLRRWQRGETGYPIVDAGMRELLTTGWMHNRVRMIVGSFLTKDLLIAWKDGARWFWDTLVDADLANNTLGWQWVAGCGADAAPYFRIFNPVTQGKRFDPDGEYVLRWIPELAALPARWIHEPWKTPANILSKAGIALDQSYPSPIVDHAEARQAALAAFRQLRE
jgi:deoxyribodipyrimidine photo-lyase